MGSAIDCRVVVTGTISAGCIDALARCLEAELGAAPSIRIRGRWQGDGISLDQGGAPRPARVSFAEPVEVLSIGRRFVRVCAVAPVAVVPERGSGVVVEIGINKEE